MPKRFYLLPNEFKMVPQVMHATQKCTQNLNLLCASILEHIRLEWLLLYNTPIEFMMAQLVSQLWHISRPTFVKPHVPDLYFLTLKLHSTRMLKLFFQQNTTQCKLHKYFSTSQKMLHAFPINATFCKPSRLP